MSIARGGVACLALLLFVGAALAESPEGSPGDSPGNALPQPVAVGPVKMKLPAGAKVLIPALAQLPKDPKQTLAGFSVTYPVYTGPGRLKNYRLTIETPGDKRVAFSTRLFQAPPETAAARFIIDLPQGTTLKFASARVAAAGENQTLVTIPRDLELELPAGIVFRPAP